MSMANKFNQGDVVVLKSGGVPMTIRRVPGDTHPRDRTATLKGYWCEWQKGASPMDHVYEEHVLQPFVAPAKP